MNSSMTFDTSLIKKYDTLAPRYTSYPTAPQFEVTFGEKDFSKHAQYSNASLLPKDLSVYVHIPFCHSLCYFCGCNKVVTQTNNQKVDAYLEYLYREITMRGRLFSDDRLVTQIHFGGGTPNFLRLEQIADLLDQIALQFHLDLPSNLEIGIELDPRAASPSDINHLAALGFNRFSIGVQDFSHDVQVAVNREQNEPATLAAINAAMTTGASVNVDLIIGLPQQTLTSFEATLDKVINTGVTRVAAYNFAYLPEHIKAQRMIKANSLPSVNERLQLTQLVRTKLLLAGYQHIGMDHYALPGDSLVIAQKNNTLQRNFQGYTTHKNTDLIGIGVSAISKFDTAFSQNETQLSLYNERIENKSLPIARGLSLTEDDRICAGLIQQLMCQSYVDLSYSIGRYIERDCDVLLLDYFAPELAKLKGFEEDKLVLRNHNGFNITDNGRYFMRPIAALFDRYLDADSGETNRVVRFSRTI